MIGEERRQCIKSIEIMWEGVRRREAAELLGECINLQRLYIGVGSGTTQHTKHPQENLWLSRGVGQLKKIRDLPNLDLRVREVNCWGRWCQWPVFELSIREAHQCMFRFLPPKFDAGHIAEFEKGLKEGMRRLEEESAKEEVAIEDSSPKTSEQIKRNKNGSKSRVLRARKVNTKISRGKKTRKLPARRAGKNREVSRGARGS